MKYILSLLILSLINLQIICDKASKVVKYAESKVGCGYFILGNGQLCNKEFLKRFPKYYQQDLKIIKWMGKQVFSGYSLVASAFHQVGIKLYIGRGVEGWKIGEWESQGTISNLPNKVCILFMPRTSGLDEIGIYIGNGEYIQAKGYNEGVIKGTMPGIWGYWGIPKGLYDNEPDQDKPKEKITSFPCKAKVIVSSDKVVDIRKSPSKNSSILLRIKFGTIVTIIGEENNWYKVTYDIISGYIMKEFLHKA